MIIVISIIGEHSNHDQEANLVKWDQNQTFCPTVGPIICVG